MTQLPISKPVRQSLAYAAMSLLVVWHSLAMVVATAPDSEISESARSLVQPYLTLFRLDNNWGFFAPNVPKGFQFRYVIEDAAGTRHTFIPEEKLNRFLPTSIWFRDRYKTVMESHEAHGEATAALLCKEHASLKPVSVTLVELEQNAFTPADRLSGKHPLDPEFVKVNTLMTVPCPNP